MEEKPIGQEVQNKGLDVMLGRNVPSGQGTQVLPFSISPGGQVRPVSMGITGISVEEKRGRSSRKIMMLRCMMMVRNVSCGEIHGGCDRVSAQCLVK